MGENLYIIGRQFVRCTEGEGDASVFIGPKERFKEKCAAERCPDGDITFLNFPVPAPGFTVDGFGFQKTLFSFQEAGSWQRGKEDIAREWVQAGDRAARGGCMDAFCRIAAKLHKGPLVGGYRIDALVKHCHQSLCSGSSLQCERTECARGRFIGKGREGQWQVKPGGP